MSPLVEIFACLITKRDAKLYFLCNERYFSGTTALFLSVVSLKTIFPLLNSKNIFYTSLKLTSFFRERVGTLGKGQGETFIINMLSVL